MTAAKRHLGLHSLFFLLSTTSLPVAAQDRPKCYTTAGNLIRDPGVVPCNLNATASGEPGSHSSCCNELTGDICLTTGLCLSLNAKTPSGMLWLNGCTDPTWRDPACPQYCNPPAGSSRDSPNPTLRACTPKTRCCAGYYQNDEECCENDFNLTSRGVGRIERILVNPEDAELLDPTSSTAPPSNSPSDGPDNSNNQGTCKASSESSSNGTSLNGDEPGLRNSTAAAITGGVLGTLLLGVSIALALLFIQNRRLKRKLLSDGAQSPTNTHYANSTHPGSHTISSSGMETEDLTYKYPPRQHNISPGRVSEVADPHYGVSPPGWVPTELPVSEGRGQLEA
ncbi:hypothetical protein V8F20_008118 [Naviculisporaceae sp. PSN 640]